MLKSTAEILVVILAILLVFCTIASRSFDKYGYALPLGWPASRMSGDSALRGACTSSEPLDNQGFPFVEHRYSEDSCSHDYNMLAFVFNNAVYSAGYLLMAGAVIMGAVNGSKYLKRCHE